jgi:uncharacterized protein YecE (DUF72 family)
VHGYEGRREVDGKAVYNYNWTQEGVLSDGNASVAQVMGVSPERVAKVRRRAEAAGDLEPADVFIGEQGARLRFQMAEAGKRITASTDKEAVTLFEFRLPDSTTLTATSQQDLALIDYPRMPRMQEVTTDFSYIRWLGNRREFPEGHTHLKKNRDDDLSWWSDVVDRFLEEGRTVFAYANNHYQNHSPSTLARFLELRRGDT